MLDADASPARPCQGLAARSALHRNGRHKRQGISSIEATGSVPVLHGLGCEFHVWIPSYRCAVAIKLAKIAALLVSTLKGFPVKA